MKTCLGRLGTGFVIFGGIADRFALVELRYQLRRNGKRSHFRVVVVKLGNDTQAAQQGRKGQKPSNKLTNKQQCSWALGSLVVVRRGLFSRASFCRVEPSENGMSEME